MPGRALTAWVSFDRGAGGRSVSSKAGPIAGGTVGGIAGALLVALLVVYVLRGRHRHQRRWSDRRVDVLDEDMGGTEYPKGATRSNELVERYQPTPLALNGERDGYSLAPDGGSAGGYVPLETVYDSSAGDSSSGQGGGKRRASTTRVVNYVLHDDAGPSVAVPEAAVLEPVTIEMPPAYGDLRKDKAVWDGL